MGIDEDVEAVKAAASKSYAAGVPREEQGDIIIRHQPKDENLEFAKEFVSSGSLPPSTNTPNTGQPYDAVNPPHYQRGPVLDISEVEGDWLQVQCIDVFRHISDPRLATAFKYIWRVAFGGKADPNYQGTQRDIDERDINSAIWYLRDWVDNHVERDRARKELDRLDAELARVRYDASQRSEPKNSGIDVD